MRSPHDCFTVFLLFQVLACLPARGLAQESAPATLNAEELVSRTQAAIEDLTGLEAKSLADQEALHQSEQDLRQVIADLEQPLPERPLPLDQLAGNDPERIDAQLAIAEDFRKAWQRRNGRYQRATETSSC